MNTNTWVEYVHKYVAQPNKFAKVQYRTGKNWLVSCQDIHGYTYDFSIMASMGALKITATDNNEPFQYQRAISEQLEFHLLDKELEYMVDELVYYTS